jgi:hypothetical protein
VANNLWKKQLFVDKNFSCTNIFVYNRFDRGQKILSFAIYLFSVHTYFQVLAGEKVEVSILCNSFYTSYSPKCLGRNKYSHTI